MHSRAEHAVRRGRRHGPRILRDQHQRDARDRPRRRHRRLPQRPAPVPRQERRHLRVVQQRRARKAPPGRCAIAFSAISPTATSRSRRTSAKVDPTNAKADAEKLAGVYSTTRGSRSNFLADRRPDRPDQGRGRQGRQSAASPAPRASVGSRANGSISGRCRGATPTAMTCSTANVADGKATRFSFGELAPIIDFDRTPGYRSSAWILPLLYFSLAVLLLTGVAVADAGAGPAQIQGRRFGSRAGSCGLPLEPDRGDRDPRRPDRLGASPMSALFGDLANAGDASNSILILLQLLSIVVFIGGFAVMLWYAWTAVAIGGWRWPAQGVERPARHRRGDGPLRRPGLQADRPDDQLLMARLSLAYRVETHRLAAPFRISGFVFEDVGRGGRRARRRRARGRGEGGGRLLPRRRFRRISSPSSSAHRDAIEHCGSREELLELMPRGGARNAVDCAMWELEAKRGRTAARQLAGVDQPKPLVTTFTLGADDPERDGRRRARLCRTRRRSRSS